ncbi:hypothetical protein AVEN_163831-1 [Araneus ventricosus]|uniref:Uncharacterized protein n=1 Tax=Araneus ventricosus TaxID=182803 RepID=A0A4Y2WIN8_ARAVE|nr:hypothetical protein AVEN_163831-1 [Araneus ventricosus]
MNIFNVTNNGLVVKGNDLSACLYDMGHILFWPIPHHTLPLNINLCDFAPLIMGCGYVIVEAFWLNRPLKGGEIHGQALVC